MTPSPTHATDAAAAPAPGYALDDFYASRHPVRRFVGGLAVVALALLTVWWLGLLAPRLGLDGERGSFDPSTGAGVLEVDLTNDAPLTVEVVRIEVGAGAEVERVTVAHEPVDTRPALAGASTRTVRLDYRAEACILDLRAGWTSVHVEVRTPSGRERSEIFFLDDVENACSAPSTG